jgi:hypothetical protein
MKMGIRRNQRGGQGNRRQRDFHQVNPQVRRRDNAQVRRRGFGGRNQNNFNDNRRFPVMNNNNPRRFNTRGRGGRNFVRGGVNTNRGGNRGIRGNRGDRGSKGKNFEERLNDDLDNYFKKNTDTYKDKLDADLDTYKKTEVVEENK